MSQSDPLMEPTLHPLPVIEKGVPIPPKCNNAGTSWATLLVGMQNGDSFLVKTEQERVVALKTAARLEIACVTRKVDGEGIRIWRVGTEFVQRKSGRPMTREKNQARK